MFPDNIMWLLCFCMQNCEKLFILSPAGDTKVKDPDDLSADTMAK